MSGGKSALNPGSEAVAAGAAETASAGKLAADLALAAAGHGFSNADQQD